MEKALPEAPSLAQCEQELIAAGWVHVHASPFWRAPNGYLFPGPTLAWQMLQTGEGTKEKRCGLCGQRLDNPANVPTPSPEVGTTEPTSMDHFTREAEREALKASTNKTR